MAERSTSGSKLPMASVSFSTSLGLELNVQPWVVKIFLSNPRVGNIPDDWSMSFDDRCIGPGQLIE